MRKRLTMALAAGAMMAAMVPGVASANDNRGCPPSNAGWRAFYVYVGEFSDRNGDGTACFLFIGDRPIATANIDNSIPE